MLDKLPDMVLLEEVLLAIYNSDKTGMQKG
jgi:hypothetical protein